MIENILKNKISLTSKKFIEKITESHNTEIIIHKINTSISKEEYLKNENAIFLDLLSLEITNKIDSWIVDQLIKSSNYSLKVNCKKELIQNIHPIVKQHLDFARKNISYNYKGWKEPEQNFLITSPALAGVLFEEKNKNKFVHYYGNYKFYEDKLDVYVDPAFSDGEILFGNSEGTELSVSKLIDTTNNPYLEFYSGLALKVQNKDSFIYINMI